MQDIQGKFPSMHILSFLTVRPALASIVGTPEDCPFHVTLHSIHGTKTEGHQQEAAIWELGNPGLVVVGDPQGSPLGRNGSSRERLRIDDMDWQVVSNGSLGRGRLARGMENGRQQEENRQAMDKFGHVVKRLQLIECHGKAPAESGDQVRVIGKRFENIKHQLVCLLARCLSILLD